MTEKSRAELAAELGYWPATTDEADIAEHRRKNAATDASQTREQVQRKHAHTRNPYSDDPLWPRCMDSR